MDTSPPSFTGSLEAIEVFVVLLGMLVGLLLLWWLLARLLRAFYSWLDVPVRRGGRFAQAWLLPWRERMRVRFPKLEGMISRRLDPTHVSGLTMTLMAVAGAYLVFLFAGLVEELFEANELAAIDDTLVSLVEPLRADAVVPVFIWITELGSMPTLTAIAIVATGFLWARGPKLYILPIWLTVLGSQATTWAGKFAFNRTRPDFVLDVTAYSPSFPSGHTTGALAVYGIVAYAMSRDLTNNWRTYDVAYWTAVIVMLVGFSRVYLGVHFPSDVAAGLLVGSFWLIAGIAMAELARARLHSPAAPPERLD